MIFIYWVLASILFGMSWALIKMNKKICDIKEENSLLRDEIKYLRKQEDINKVKSYTKKDFGLKQAMIQQTQADVAKRLQSYLSTEGFYANS